LLQRKIPRQNQPSFQTCRQRQLLAHCRDLELVADCAEFLAAFTPGAISLVLELTERELIELCAKLDLDIVAEGVETEEQSDYLTTHGVNFLQGYLFGRPMPGAEFINALSHH
jgi:hypothetical protein